MHTVQLFNDGDFQVVHLPREFEWPGDEVKISRQGNRIILEPVELNWDAFFASLDMFPKDFMDCGRRQPEQQG